MEARWLVLCHSNIDRMEFLCKTPTIAIRLAMTVARAHQSSAFIYDGERKRKRGEPVFIASPTGQMAGDIWTHPQVRKLLPKGVSI